VTFPDVISGLAEASGGMVTQDDFSPLPCAHPNCHQLLLAARDGDQLVPLNRMAPVRDNLDLIAGGISFTPQRASQLVDLFLARASHCGSDCGCHEVVGIGTAQRSPQRPSVQHDASNPVDPRLQAFFGKVLTGKATARDLFRVTITSFLDAYNFDVRQLMKCCTHHVLPSGHVIPFCAYNTLYRPGHLPLPAITAAPISRSREK
jgi:hypothetical protein